MKKKIIALLGVSLLFTGMVAISATNSFVVAKAEGEDAIVETVSEEETKDTLQQFKDTFLVPLLSSVSVTSILAFIVSITCSAINRKTNSKLKEITTNAIDGAMDISIKANDMYCQVRDLYVSLKDLQDKIVEQKDSLDHDFNMVKEQMEKLYGMKEDVLKLAKIQASIACHNSELVASGVAEDIYKIVEDVKKIV